MAYKVETDKVYHAQNHNIGSGIIEVIGGTIKIVGSNVTE